MHKFWIFSLIVLVAILLGLLLFVFKKNKLINKLNAIFAMNTVIVLLIMNIGMIDGRMDMYSDIALSYSILGFVTSVILAKFIGGKRR
ncbi:MAG: pH regulation protein F [Clostridiales bacterium]|nr:pH regulation protein F [Candidatus Crickella equi]